MSRRAVAVGALALVGVGAAVVLVVGVGGGPGSAPWDVPQVVEDRDRSQGARPYRLRPEARFVWITIQPDHCWLEERSPVDRIEVVETDETVTITPYVERSTAGEDCWSEHTERVRLNAPLGHRTLVDGHEDRELPINGPDDRY